MQTGARDFRFFIITVNYSGRKGIAGHRMRFTVFLTFQTGEPVVLQPLVF